MRMFVWMFGFVISFSAVFSLSLDIRQTRLWSGISPSFRVRLHALKFSPSAWRFNPFNKNVATPTTATFAQIALEQSQAQLEQRRFEEAVRRLLWLATPESVCRLMAEPEQCRRIQSTFGVDVAGTYFNEQSHADLPSFMVSPAADSFIH